MGRLTFCASLAAALALVPAGLAAQEATPAPSATPLVAQVPAEPAPEPVEYAYVALKTAKGTITLALDTTHAPKTSANFLKYVDAKNLDGALFYRAMHLPYGEGEDQGLLQGGVRNAAKLLAPVAHESTNETGITHTTGTISMARFAPGTATADFMIMLSDMPALDAEEGNTGEDPGAGFAAFGHVAAGMDVVKAIWSQPRSATKGEGVMKGDILENEVPILSARRTSAPPKAPEPPKIPKAPSAVEAEAPTPTS